MGTLRRLVAMSLLLLFGLSFAPALLALTVSSEAGLPRCCRKAGKHHCMGVAEPNRDEGRQVKARAEACPSCPAAVTSFHAAHGLGAPARAAFYADVVSHPAVQAQSQVRWRVARERARGKRGPPILA